MKMAKMSCCFNAVAVDVEHKTLFEANHCTMEIPLKLRFLSHCLFACFCFTFFLSSGLFLGRASSLQSYTNTQKRCYALISNIQYLSLNSLQFFLLYILFSFLFFYIYTQSTLNQLCYMKIFCAWCREIRLSLHHIFVCIFFSLVSGWFILSVCNVLYIFYVFCTLFIPFFSD